MDTQHNPTTSKTLSNTPNQNPTNTHNLTSTQINKISTSQYITFCDDDKGPDFHIFLEKENINEISIGVLLKRLNFKNITELKKINRNRIKLTLNNKNEANKILNNQTMLKLHQIKSFIPKSLIISTGIVRDVPTDLSLQELKDSCRVPNGIAVSNIERMTYWNREKQIAENGTSIKIEFRSTQLPTEICIFYVKKRVEHFIPKPTLCRKCLRYGHVKAICKSNIKQCINCTEETHAYNKDCECIHCNKKCALKCKYCDTNDHNTLMTSCKEYKKQLKIKKEIIINKKTFMEAKNLVENELNFPEILQPTYSQTVKLADEMAKIKIELNELKETNQILLHKLQNAEDFIERVSKVATKNIETINIEKLENTEEKNINSTPKKETIISNIIISEIKKFKEKNKSIPTRNEDMEMETDGLEFFE